MSIFTLYFGLVKVNQVVHYNGFISGLSGQENDFICVESRKSRKSKERKSVVIIRPMTRSQKKKLTFLPSLLVEMSRGREKRKKKRKNLLEWQGVGKKGMSSCLTELIHEHALDVIGF
jgi:hypothetical protein